MRVRVKFFASYREAMGEGELDMELEKGKTVSDLVEDLRGRYKVLKDLSDVLVVSVNQEYATYETELKDGDEVALMPPVSGG